MTEETKPLIIDVASISRDIADGHLPRVILGKDLKAGDHFLYYNTPDPTCYNNGYELSIALPYTEKELSRIDVYGEPKIGDLFGRDLINLNETDFEIVPDESYLLIWRPQADHKETDDD